MSDGDGVLFDATLENSAAGELTVKVTVDARDVINVDVRNNDSLDDGCKDALGSDDGRDHRIAAHANGTVDPRLRMVIPHALQTL